VPVAQLRLIRRCFEFAPQEDYLTVPPGTRGIYVLYRRRRLRGGAEHGAHRFDVVYIGLANVGVRRRLLSHVRQKGGEWTHFSVYEVWDNIRQDEIAELEGLFRHIYRFDSHANRLNIAKSYQRLRRVRREAAEEGWMGEAAPGDTARACYARSDSGYSRDLWRLSRRSTSSPPLHLGADLQVLACSPNGI
jgi:hypothetical protein